MITWGRYQAKYHSMKGNVLALTAIIFSTIIHWGPILIGLYLIFWHGKILIGVLFPILWWVTLGFYFALLPIWWIIGIFKYGFIESTLFCLVVFGIFSLPDILFYLAAKQMEKAERIRMLD